MHSTTPHAPAASRAFARSLPSTRRGARLARLLAAERLRSWEVSPAAAERAERITAELASNAVLHGRVRGRGFRLVLLLDGTAGRLRVAVTDARGDRVPVPSVAPLREESESGRGLLLVELLADRWGTEPYPPGGKTVWAELDGHPAGPP
ncbi:ATP-binding protein [Streptomyces sp. MRC013]|uniref:ATP-binding protein n=1 Tax=Streptomyces sp. MRC013 TaxID=2898276 RepID=UPI0020265BA8|nr:ATP-binding protein [Streptomyces sp. MRC013]URM89262.1 ATP-binding protein [Streptomyces sp. MRC013]